MNGLMKYIDFEKSYYTKEQLIEICEYASKDQDDEDNTIHNMISHLKDIIEDMHKYKINLILSRDVLRYSKESELIINVYKIYPYEFEEIPLPGGENYYKLPTITAPNFGLGDCCENCIHFKDLTTYDEMTHGQCNKHTYIDNRYNPLLVTPMEVGGSSKCDDFDKKNE